LLTLVAEDLPAGIPSGVQMLPVYEWLLSGTAVLAGTRRSPLHGHSVAAQPGGDQAPGTQERECGDDQHGAGPHQASAQAGSGRCPAGASQCGRRVDTVRAYRTGDSAEGMLGCGHAVAFANEIQPVEAIIDELIDQFVTARHQFELRLGSP
jgi:hypothetical protein